MTEELYLTEPIEAAISDDRELHEAIREIEDLLSGVPFLECRECFRILNSFLDDPTSFFDLNGDPAARAGEFSLLIKRSHRLTDLNSTLRAHCLNHASVPLTATERPSSERAV